MSVLLMEVGGKTVNVQTTTWPLDTLFSAKYELISHLCKLKVSACLLYTSDAADELRGV